MLTFGPRHVCVLRVRPEFALKWAPAASVEKVRGRHMKLFHFYVLMRSALRNSKRAIWDSDGVDCD
jgi:hypothetical protein